LVLSGVPPPADSRVAVGEKRILESAYRPEAVQAAARIAAHATSRGIAPTAFAIAWVLANRNVTSAIVGPRTMGQWQSGCGATGRLSGADLTRWQGPRTGQNAAHSVVPS